MRQRWCLYYSAVVCILMNTLREKLDPSHKECYLACQYDMFVWHGVIQTGLGVESAKIVIRNDF